MSHASTDARAAAIRDAKENSIEALANFGQELPTLVMLRTSAGVEVVSFNPGSSAVLRMSPTASPLTSRQIEAAHWLERDFLVEASGGSNASAIEAWLNTSLEATPAQAEEKAFGRLMRKSKDVKLPTDHHEKKFAAAHRIGWVKMQMNAVSWSMVELVVRYQLSAADIARRTDTSREYVTGRVREALSELAAAFAAYTAMAGYSPDEGTMA
jgi:hypothetical protein